MVTSQALCPPLYIVHEHTHTHTLKETKNYGNPNSTQMGCSSALVGNPNIKRLSTDAGNILFLSTMHLSFKITDKLKDLRVSDIL